MEGIVRGFGEYAVAALKVGALGWLDELQEVEAEEAVGDGRLECRDFDVASDVVVAVVMSVGGVRGVVGAEGRETKGLRGEGEMVGE